MTTSTNGHEAIVPRYEPEPDEDEDVVAGERGTPRSGAPLGGSEPLLTPEIEEASRRWFADVDTRCPGTEPCPYPRIGCPNHPAWKRMGHDNAERCTTCGHSYRTMPVTPCVGLTPNDTRHSFGPAGYGPCKYCGITAAKYAYENTPCLGRRTEQTAAAATSTDPADADARALSGMGRRELEDLVLRLQEERRRMRDERNAVRREAKTLNENMAAVHQRCNELLNTDRIARFLDDKPTEMAALLDLAWAIHRARDLHPEGASVLALMQESGEVGRALERENAERYRSELLDTAVVAMRLYIAGPNDIDDRLQPRFPFAAKPPPGAAAR